jgi:hypothetical protein
VISYRATQSKAVRCRGDGSGRGLRSKIIRDN